MKKILAMAVLAATAITANAQSGTKSPYSQFGLGTLSEQTSSFNRGMNGLGIGFREHNQVNFTNPASYSNLDSLTFIFDAGVSGQITNYNENGKKLNAKDAYFEYVVAGFRAFKNVGVSFGILPFSNVGYSYSTGEKIGAQLDKSYTNTYSGTGGIHQVYIGVGVQPVKNLSVGANIAYLWGEYDRNVINSYSDSYIKTLTKEYYSTINSYKLDLGAQYTFPIDKNNLLTIGATFTPGHKLGSSPECLLISTNPSTSVNDTTRYSLKNALELPTMFGAGIMWHHNSQWKIGADVSLQQWGKTSFPVFENNSYAPKKDYFKDRTKVTVGGEYCRGEYMRGFFNRVRYRAGFSYATPYMKINGQDGPKELSVSAGFSMPIMNHWNNRSALSVSGQWVQQSGKGMIKENTFRINIGMTFNERWFMKWKVE